ncbi:MAG: tryptophan synthase subunit alpha [Candidatus Omnitrophica bacterium 4484_171]|nr:MAG: tryptophan synthase subunit alpha [Candidatus Omnitrophica bacterium 4484_171]
MGRIDEKFQELKTAKKKAFITYLTFGFPYISFTKDIILALQNTPVDMIEIGVPFSDPLADGPILQEASKIAISKGADSDKLFSVLNSLKGKISTPLIIMTYYNPVYRFGVDKFLNNAKKADVSGIMVVDLPVEEASYFIRKSRRLNIDTIFFITPQTQNRRIKEIAEASRGFIYYISVAGITGPRSLSLNSIHKNIRYIKKFSKIPVCVGFGIHKRTQVKELFKISDGVIVGSALAKFIKSSYKDKDFFNKLERFIKRLYV